MSHYIAVFLALLAASACEDPAQLTVDVRTDWKPLVDFETVQTELSPTPFEEASATAGRSVMATAAAADDFFAGQRVAELDGVPLGRSFVRVTLLDAGGGRVAQRVVDLRLDESFALTVVMTRNCRDVVCPGPTDAPELSACLDGRCVDLRCTTSAPEHCGDPVCATAADCEALAGCERGACAAGVCLCDSPVTVEDGGPPAEDAGPGCPVDCDDGNPCTDDGCDDPAVGCVHTDNAASCDDGDACTTGDRCGGGVCAGSARSCDDGNPCTDDSCDRGAGCRNVSRPDHSTCGAANMRCCGGSCVDIRTDPRHCSGCGQACASGRACIIYDGQPACDCVANSECRGGNGQVCSTTYGLTCACTGTSGCVAGQTCVDRSGSTNYCTY